MPPPPCSSPPPPPPPCLPPVLTRGCPRRVTPYSSSPKPLEHGTKSPSPRMKRSCKHRIVRKLYLVLLTLVFRYTRDGEAISTTSAQMVLEAVAILRRVPGPGWATFNLLRSVTQGCWADHSTAFNKFKIVLDCIVPSPRCKAKPTMTSGSAKFWMQWHL